MTTKDYIIAPSILSADFARLGEEAESVLTSGADWIHFDVMDNHYVPNLTIGPMVCKALRDYGINAPIDTHLMVKPVDSLIESFARAGSTYITFHPEATDHIDRSIELIKSHDCKAGLVLNPATVRDTIDRKNLDVRLEVDGGINLENIATVAEAGADTFVAGSAIFNQEDYSKIIKQMRSSLEAL